MINLNTDVRSYQPINSYGVIGDCRSVVLVAPDGSVDWGCLPDFDSPAIFCRLLDAEHGGYFQIAPSDAAIPGTQHYLSGSNILQTRFTSIFGEITLTDFMPVETLSARLLQKMNGTGTTGAGEENASYSLIRIVECTRGELPVTMILKASPLYAAASSAAYLVSKNTGAVVSGGEQRHHPDNCVRIQRAFPNRVA
jgi:GH15 family glucan-1,4-alpha-glucosidase